MRPSKTLKFQNKTTPKQTSTKVPHTKQLKQITYYVKKGDSLEKISKEYKIKIADLKRWNQISDINHLKIRQPLVLYIRK